MPLESSSDTPVREFDFTRNDFDFLRELTNRHTGIVLGDDKFNMMYSRLARRIRSLNLKNFGDYCSYLGKNEEQECIELINALTTNLTSFFRENYHFEYMADDFIPELLKENKLKKTIRIWSAGCSTGEEAYSLAITLRERVPRDWDIKILATDIDSSVLKTGKQGVYAESRIAGLADVMKKRWFQAVSDSNGQDYQIDQLLRDMVEFKQTNLLGKWLIQGPFDAIFCRNVTIYFDKEHQKELMDKFATYMHLGSRLFLGHSETMNDYVNKFTPLGKTIYRLTE